MVKKVRVNKLIFIIIVSVYDTIYYKLLIVVKVLT